jgi:hypothetical protein
LTKEVQVVRVELLHTPVAFSLLALTHHIQLSVRRVISSSLEHITLGREGLKGPAFVSV